MGKTCDQCIHSWRLNKPRQLFGMRLGEKSVLKCNRRDNPSPCSLWEEPRVPTPDDHAAIYQKPPLAPEKAREIAESLSYPERRVLIWIIKDQDTNDDWIRLHQDSPAYDKLHGLELIWSPFILPATHWRPAPKAGVTNWGREVAALYFRKEARD